MTGVIIAISVLALGQPQQTVPVETPASVVASHVRNALANPSETVDWEGLEASVQTLEAEGADVATAGWESRVEAALYWVDEIIQAVGFEVLLGGLILVLTISVAGRFTLRALRSRSRRSQQATSSAVVKDVSGGRAWAASVLSSQGLTSVEIAQRTGLARDAISLALHTNPAEADPQLRGYA